MRVGVTGHQRLDEPTAWGWVAKAIEQELDALPWHLVGVTSLALGSDQLFAQVVLQCGGSIHAVIPFPGYERTFHGAVLQKYRQLSAHAEIEVLNIAGSEQDAYLTSGRRVADLSELMFAVWDGLPAKGKGGTADIVAYALAKKVPLIHFNPSDRSVIRR